jgi:hypothetical protein
MQLPTAGCFSFAELPVFVCLSNPNPDAVVAGCELPFMHLICDYHIFFVCALHEQAAPAASNGKSLKIQIMLT